MGRERAYINVLIAKQVDGIIFIAVGCITGPSEATPSADRVKGYQRALRDADVEWQEALIEPADFRYEGGAELCAEAHRP